MSYYAEVAPYLLHQAQGRGLMVKRWPHGIDGSMFYQKHPPEGGPIVLDDVDSLLRWVSQGVLEWHAPLGTLPNPLLHDWAIMDLDPNPPAEWDMVVQVAEVFKALLTLMEIPFLLKTSGQHGLHFYIAIEPLHHQDVLKVMAGWAEMVVHTIPEWATTARLKRDRGARIYLDYQQNGYQRTTVMAYSLRATAVASVSMPIRWEEITVPAEEWTMDRAREHLAQYGNLFLWTGPRINLREVSQRHGLLEGKGVMH